MTLSWSDAKALGPAIFSSTRVQARLLDAADWSAPLYTPNRLPEGRRKQNYGAVVVGLPGAPGYA